MQGKASEYAVDSSGLYDGVSGWLPGRGATSHRLILGFTFVLGHIKIFFAGTKTKN
jgi:hypothetical protein